MNNMKMIKEVCSNIMRNRHASRFFFLRITVIVLTELSRADYLKDSKKKEKDTQKLKDSTRRLTLFSL